MSVEEQLRLWLKGWKKVAILGIGSPLRTDDGVGSIVIQKLSKYNLPENVRLFNCETAPENFTREIKILNPSNILLVDSAQIDLKPGKAKLVSTEKIMGFPITTHTMPLNSLSEYLKYFTKAKIILLAIQPKDVAFGKGLTPELEKASTQISLLIAKLISDSR